MTLFSQRGAAGLALALAACTSNGLDYVKPTATTAYRTAQPAAAQPAPAAPQGGAPAHE